MHVSWHFKQCDKDEDPRRLARRSMRRSMGACAAALCALFASTATAAELSSGGYVWMMGVNGTLSARHPVTLKTAAQAPDAGAIALSGNRKRLFGMESAVGRIFEINTRTMVSTPIVELKQPLGALCASPDGSRLLASSVSKKTLHIIDTVAKQAAVIPVEGKAISSCQFGPDGSAAYVIPGAADEVIVIDVKGSKAFGKVAMEGARPSKLTEVVVHPNPARKLALVLGGTQIFYLDTAAHKLVGAATSLGAQAQGAAFHPDGARFYALTPDKALLIDLQSRAPQKTLELPAGALFRGVAIDAQGKHLYLSGNHETAGDVGAILNRDGKEFVSFDLDTGKKTYQAFPPVQAVLFIVTP